jgi:hypothetical protein
MSRNNPGRRRPRASSKPKSTEQTAAREHEHGHGQGPAATKATSFHDQVMGQMDPTVRKELDDLRRHESKILAGLKNPETARLFVSDPRAALVKMKVPLSAQMRASLKDAKPPQDLLQPKGYRLPNGQVVVPTVTIRFTKQEDVSHDG